MKRFLALWAAVLATVVGLSACTASTKTQSSGGTGGGIGGAGGGGRAASQPQNASNNLVIDGASEADAWKSLSPEQKKRAQLQSRFHPSVLAVVDRLKDNKLSPSADETKFIHNGKAEIQIWLTDKSDETIAKLKELGFEVVLDPKTAKLVIGRLPIEKLAALAELKSVRYVAPQTAN